jgi:hypothetical protein
VIAPPSGVEIPGIFSFLILVRSPGLASMLPPALPPFTSGAVVILVAFSQCPSVV